MFTLFWSQNFQNHRHSFTLNLTQLAGYIRLRDKPFLYFLTDSELYYIRDLWPWFSPLGKLADWALFRNFLARSAKLPTGLYILLALISVFFFFLFFIFLMIFRRQIITGSAGPIFVIFSLNESVLGADDRSGPFFRYLKGSCHGNQLCEKKANSALSSLWHSEMVWDNAVYMHDLLAPQVPLHRVKFCWRSVQ